MSEQNNETLQKATLEIELLRKELDIKEKELELKEKELQDLGKRKIWKIDPVIVGIVAALIGFLGNVIATFLQGRSSLELERTRQGANRSLETDKFRSSLILEAIKTGDPEKAARNIEFFLAAGLLEDQSGKISLYLSEKNKIPVLPSKSPGLSAGEPVERLPLGDAYRQIASAVGLLAVDTQCVCTAWVISKEYLITADYCISAFNAPVKHLTLRMGFISQQEPSVEYSVDPKPVELDENLGYAILKVQGDPSDRFGVIPLATREPILGEPLFILHHSGAKPLALTRGRTCHVTTAQSDSEVSFGHTCDTLGGSGGAPVIAANDFRVLGLHHSGSSDGKWELAKRFSLIIKQSKILQSVIAQSPSGGKAVLR
jgi:hypothetical protein